jgi:hypothetical protein
MLMISGAAAVAALVAGRFGGLARIVLALSPRTHDDLNAHLEHLVHIATIAHHEGLLIVERHPALRHHPLLRRGIGLALDGHTPAAIRERLGGSDTRAAAPSYWSAPHQVVRPLQCASIALTAGVLLVLVAIIASGRTVAQPGAAIAWFSICAAMITLAISSLATDSAGGHSGQILDAMRIETAALIAAGCEPRSIRASLLAMIQPADATPLTRAA